MNYLLDEQLDEVVERAINPLADADGDNFVHILSISKPATPDTEIPGICQKAGISCLVTANVRDFGARKVYYQALLANNVHVAVLRPGKVKFHADAQVALLASSRNRLRLLLVRAARPTLVKCTASEVTERSIEELVEEIDRGRRIP